MADFIDCDNNSLTLEDIVQSLFATNAAGEVGIRVILDVDSGVPAVDCDNNAVMTSENLMRLSIEVTPNGPAIRLLQ